MKQGYGGTVKKVSMLTRFLFVIAVSTTIHGQIVNRVVNASFENGDTTNPDLASGWQTFGGSYSRVSTKGAWDGNFVIQLTANSGAVQKIVLNQAVAIPVRLSARIKGDMIADDPTDKMGGSLDCKVIYHDGTAGYCPVTLKTKNVGTFDWKWIGYNTGNFASPAVPIDSIEIRLRMGAVSGVATFDDIHVEEWNPQTNGLVTFMFDDSFLSTYTKAFPILRDAGFVGTEAVITSYVGKDAIHMTLPQLYELFGSGWSIVSHTVHHTDLSTDDLVTLNDELYWSHKFLIDAGFPVQHIALPFGGYNALVMTRAQAERYAGFKYLSVRTSDNGQNPQGAFPYNVRVQPVVTTTTVQNVLDWLETAKTQKTWLVLLLHEVDSSTNGIYSVSSDTLKDIVSAVKASGLPVVTYDGGFNMMMSPMSVSGASVVQYLRIN